MPKIAEIKKVDEIIKKFNGKQSGLIGMLQGVQNEYDYLPEEALKHIADKVEVPLSRVYSLATFYRVFSLKPRGKYLISLCVGTACHVRGADRIADEIKRKLCIETGQTTDDLKFTFETVNCLGCCAIGPVMMISGKYYGQLTAAKVGAILEKYKND